MSRAIKPFSEPGRPPDWFSQKVRQPQTYTALYPFVSFTIQFLNYVFFKDRMLSFIVSISFKITHFLLHQHCASQYSELLEATEAPKLVLQDTLIYVQNHDNDFLKTMGKIF